MSGKLNNLLNTQVRVILNDGRQIIGTLLSFDAHMNIVLDHTQEFRKTRAKNTVQRALGLIMLRGENVISTIPETAYKGDDKLRTAKQPISLKLQPKA